MSQSSNSDPPDELSGVDELEAPHSRDPDPATRRSIEFVQQSPSSSQWPGTASASQIKAGSGVPSRDSDFDARRLGELLRERDEHLRLIVESATDFAIFTLGLDGRVVSWNIGAERILGYTEEEILGKHVSVIFTPEDVAAGRVEFEMGAAAYDGCKNDDRWHVRKGGVRFWANGLMMPLTDEANQTRGYVKILRDRTEQKLASEMLRASEERLAIAVDGAMLGLWHCDLPSGGMVWTERCKEHLGFAPDARGTLGSLLDHLHPEDRTKAQGIIDHSLRDCTAFDTEFRIVGPDGQIRWIQTKGRATANDFAETCRIDGVTMDVTERKTREEWLKEADRRKDEFLSLLAHELRNPLAAINNAVELWLRTERPVDVAWVKEVIQRQAKHLARLIDDLLDVSQISRGMVELHKEHVDLVPLIKRAVERVRPLLDRKRLDLSVAAGEVPIEVIADPMRIEQVIMNLLSNAAKYTHERGKIGLTVEAGPEVTVTVKDDGVGIPPEMLPHIFDVLVQVNPALDRASGGLGIGLTVVKNLIERHGGSVSASSEGPGKGSQFTFRLPALARHSEPPNKGDAQPATKQSMRVLLVDDHRDSAAGLMRLLRLAGYDVLTAPDGPAAIDIARTEQPQVVLLDIGLPGMNGYQVAEQIRKEQGSRTVFLVAISGYGQEQDRRRSKDAGFDLHLVKPVDFPQFSALLESRRASARLP